ncbi:hypothetical protein GGR28_001024 [Lewinella aquimaris]|uniref:DNA mismatch repair proteins mutS family domain-containing protein n=1 Tax=Neolewinella aquimaris TaxID=1835722 RepID=A0A840DZI6_9BACT|nr:hypothetical protein [Neolewinella aquimaris]MBB4078411.1 hypothetical protein [Neolewinella aquimaris]
MNAPETYYTELARTQLDRARRLQQCYDRLAIVRLLFVVGFVGLLIFSWSTGFWAGALTTLTGTVLLAFGVRYHQRIGQAAAGARVQGQLAEAEITGLAHQFSQWPDGREYASPDHPYAGDLDIFGPHSLFQYLNRTVTAIGSHRLAEQLSIPAPHPVSETRRAAGRELATRPDWCMEFRTRGNELADDPAYARRLLEWANRPAVVTGAYARAMRFAAPALSAIGIWFSFTQQPWQLGLLFFIPAFLLLRRYSEAAATEHAYTAQAGRILQGYQRLFQHMEAEASELPTASAAIGRLSFYVSQLDVRYNPFVFMLEITGLWSIQWLYRLDSWRTAHRDDLPRWLEALAETDARVSWATLRFNQPTWTEPELTDEKVLQATGLAHPLLPPTGRVTNDVSMSTDGHIDLVTGSNMAGKSTWLRTVGINIVLARAGGPVCALRLRTAALQVWTSMRTHDDLSESTSSFYAELKRLKAIIEAVSDSEQQVFFLLDEILKGTNSRDRHTGSRALIRQLIRERGAGIIATHDLELAALENEPGSRVENYAMEVQTKNGELVFDYKLHRGVSRSFNATALMARMGIDIDPEDIKLTHD